MDLFRSSFRRFAVVVGLTLLATACASGGSASSSNYVELPESTPVESGLITSTATGVTAEVASGSLTVAAPTSPGTSVAQETFDEVEAFYDTYLGLRANAIDRTSEIDVVDDVTTASGRAEIANALAYNDGLHADRRLSAVDAVYLFANVESVWQIDDDTLMLTDCTEQHEINSLNQHLVFFPSAEVRIDVSAGQMRVDSYTVTHNGYLEAGEALGCAPMSFRERAEATSAQVWTELAAWARNSEDRTDEDLSAMIGEPLRERLLFGPAGFELAEHVEETTFGAVGLDTHGRLGAAGPEGLVVQVESCHRFPEGRSGFDPATQIEIQDVRPGAEQALRFHVLLDPDSGNARIDQVLAIDYIADRCR